MQYVDCNIQTEREGAPHAKTPDRLQKQLAQSCRALLLLSRCIFEAQCFQVFLLGPEIASERPGAEGTKKRTSWQGR